MKKQILFAVFSLLLMQSVYAAGTHYEMRIDGLACPFCVYGVEKKLKALDGISNFKVDLDKGLVSVDMVEGKSLTDEQMKKLMNDAGFTFRSMKKSAL